jgi:hypothetical protein
MPRVIWWQRGSICVNIYPPMKLLKKGMHPSITTRKLAWKKCLASGMRNTGLLVSERVPFAIA